MEDDRGYIEIISDQGDILGFLSEIDTDSGVIHVSIIEERAKRYINDDRMMLDVSIICALGCKISEYPELKDFSLRIHNSYGVY